MSGAACWTLLACLLLAHNAAADEPLWSGTVPEPCRVQLEHPAGDLALERVRGSTLQVLGDADQWELQADSAEGLLQIRSALPPGSNAAAATQLLRVDLPRDCELVVRGGTGHVHLRGRHDAPLDIETVTGDITLWADRRASLRAELQTSGLMGVDYSIEIEHLRHQEPDKRGLVVLGDGSTRARLASRRGVVSVLDRERAARK